MWRTTPRFNLQLLHFTPLSGTLVRMPRTRLVRLTEIYDPFGGIVSPSLTSTINLITHGHSTNSDCFYTTVPFGLLHFATQSRDETPYGKMHPDLTSSTPNYSPLNARTFLNKPSSFEFSLLLEKLKFCLK